jgi:hypothetical protein
MWYRAVADLVVVVHLLIIGFIVGGVFMTWRWPVIIWAHIPAVIYGALVELAGLTCPLTLLENDLRQRAGQAGYRDGFIAHYLVRVIYPPGLTHGMQFGLGVLLLLVAMIGYWGFLRRRGWGVARALADGSRAPPLAGGAAVPPHRAPRAPAHKVTQPLRGPHPTHAGYQLSEAGLSLDFESVLRAQSSSLDRAAAMYRPQSKRS